MRQDLYDKAVEVLKKHKLLPCPSCGEMPRSVVGLGKITMLEHFDNKQAPGTGKVTPLILVGCNTCGFVWTYGAIRLGVVSPDSAAPSSGEPAHEPE
jgi:hypothetical protein